MSTHDHQHPLLIIDFGSQYTQLIARRVRDMGVYCELVSPHIDPDALVKAAPSGIILSGGPETVTGNHTLRVPPVVFALACPVLGICYGMQTMAYQLGGEVAMGTQSEFGLSQLHVLNTQGLFTGIPTDPGDDHLSFDVWMSHGDAVTRLPDGFEAIASTEHADYAAIADFKRQFFGLLFHPEVTHTRYGDHIISQFVNNICQCEAYWTPNHIIEDCVSHIRQTVGEDRVLLGLSGGVDSAVTAAILHKAIGDQLICVFVDTGLLRLGEADELLDIFHHQMHMQLIQVDAKNTFIDALQGVSDPERKRKIIGERFVHIFEAKAKKLNASYLGQGTIYPDVIESAKTKLGQGQVIKTHHNVGGLPEKMNLKLIEPLRELFKDEVRHLGIKLGLPYHLIYRHPFPGPGLGVRILGEVKPHYIPILQQADVIFIEELKSHELYFQMSQAFAVLIPMKTVGVKGDARNHGYVIALRAVKTIDFMSATWADLPYAFLSRVATRIVNEIKEVARVVYDISHKPPATIEWE